MENILISGGAGFIGSNLALKLVSLGHKVTILDNLSPQIHTESENNSQLYLSIKDKVFFIKGDVRNRKDWQKAIANNSVIVHLAAETGTGQSMYQIEKYVEVNCSGTAIMLDILANEEHQVKKVVVASSRAIYGEGKYQCSDHGDVYPSERSDEQMSKGHFEPICTKCKQSVALVSTDENSKIHPTSIYGITKSNQEQMILVACKSLGISAVSLRYQNVYGPGQSLSNPYTGILSIFSTRILNNNPINIFEDGQESRDFVFIDDVVDATVLAIQNNTIESDSFNVGSGVSTTVQTVADGLKRLYQSDVEIHVSGNYRLGDIRHNKADISKIKQTLGFTPKVPFEEGLKQFVDWVKRQDVNSDNYDHSISEMKDKGLMK
ncbi:MAG: NAD-dependent epimerase/dehydratase family protein [Flavobacteriales bacterium]|jgi:dTDP-L-rhamnose 4-epimerase|nr:NAD-dependent epimerase/dehydratase family protein [Flavobacteriales bacterium]|tara:strand:+ start:609 stop:1742 length:1134 start_codon:yes stop_codon:yes gene_type:complete